MHPGILQASWCCNISELLYHFMLLFQARHSLTPNVVNNLTSVGDHRAKEKVVSLRTREESIPRLVMDSARGKLVLAPIWLHIIFRYFLHLVDAADISKPKSEPWNLISFGTFWLKSPTCKFQQCICRCECNEERKGRKHLLICHASWNSGQVTHPHHRRPSSHWRLGLGN